MIVTMLILAGQLTPHDAVPVSKAVVFIGAIASLVLNLGRNAPRASGSLVDWLLLKMVVPMALFGTLLGVMSNEHTPGYGVVIILSATLIPMLVLLLRHAQQQMAEEATLAEDSGYDEERDAEDVRDEAASLLGKGPKVPLASSQDNVRCSTASGKLTSSGTTWTYQDAVLLGTMLLIVIIGGSLQHHVRACFNHQQQQLDPFSQPDLSGALPCQHPVLNMAFWGRAEGWIALKGFAPAAITVVLAMPSWACIGTASYYARIAMSHGWSRSRTAGFLFVAFAAGILAGFVGIGGGLIFSPFFLLVGVDPAIAVATSSTTVVFTSSSTTMQYLLMDRIHIPLALQYGAVNAVASLCGTSFTQFVGERWAMKKSYITLIVALSVFVSLFLSSKKCIELVSMAMNGVVVP